MIKRYLLFFQLVLLSATIAKAQFTAGSIGYFVSAGTQVAIHGLTMTPSADFNIASRTLTVSPTPIPGNPASISRVYHFSEPVDFAGNLGFFYQSGELNGNDEANLQLAYGNEDFVTSAGSVVIPAQGYISGNLSSVTNFTSVTAGQAGALPVTLISFQLKRVENLTMLYWQTADEKNSDFFEVQHSNDARKWNALGRVTAATESKTFKDYSFQDHISRNGRQYYRLKMVDADGSFAYSSIQSIDLPNSPVASAYPNPVTDKLQIHTTQGVASVKLTDLSGKTLVNLSKPVSGQEVPMKNYPAGTYIVQFIMADGKSQNVKIIKQ